MNDPNNNEITQKESLFYEILAGKRITLPGVDEIIDNYAEGNVKLSDITSAVRKNVGFECAFVTTCKEETGELITIYKNKTFIEKFTRYIER